MGRNTIYIVVITALIVGVSLGYFIASNIIRNEVIGGKLNEDYEIISISNGQSELDLCKETIYRTNVDFGECIRLCEEACAGDPGWCETTCRSECSGLPS